MRSARNCPAHGLVTREAAGRIPARGTECALVLAHPSDGAAEMEDRKTVTGDAILSP
jgi:hypothetical protein